MDDLDQTDLIEEHLLGKYLEQNHRIAKAIKINDEVVLHDGKFQQEREGLEL